VKKRRRGTGTIEILPDGRARPRLPDRAGLRGRRLDICDTPEEAEQLLDDALSLQAAPVGGLTLAEVGVSWLEQRELSGLSSVAADRSRWSTHIADSWLGALPIRSITRADVLQWLDELLVKRASPGHCHGKAPRRRVSRSTVQNTVNALRLCLGWALDRGLIEHNPAIGVRLPRARGQVHEPWTYLLREEQLALVECEQIPYRDRVVIRAALYLGLREGELWSLRLADVQLERGIVVVRRGSAEGPTKARRIRRLRPIAPGLEAVKEQIQLLRGGKNPHGLLFPTARGYRRQRGKPIRHWERYLALAGVHPPELRHDCQPVRWHDLRHTCASSLVAGWWGRAWHLEEVCEYLGHSGIGITRRYAHLAPSRMEEIAEATVGLYPHDTPTANG